MTAASERDVAGLEIKTLSENRVPDTIQVQRALEQLRQERETFDQRRRQDARWFMLRMTMGGLAVVIMPAFIVICTILITSPHVDATAKDLAASALLVDILGLIISVWKVVLNPASITQLAPVTTLGQAAPAHEIPEATEPKPTAEPSPEAT